MAGFMAAPRAALGPDRSFHVTLSLVVGLAAVAIGVYAARDLPLMPVLGPDSPSYLNLAPSRPPGYGLLLALFAQLWPGLAGLPQVQLAALVVASALLATAVGLRLRSVPAALAMLGLLWVPEDQRYWVRTVMADPLFLATVMLALAAMIAPWGEERALLMAGIATAVGVLLRNAGAALALALAVQVLLQARGTGARRSALLLARAVGPTIAALAVAAAVHLAVNDVAMPGGWSGVSLLGKGLLLLTPESARGLDPALATLGDEVAAAKAALAEVPGFRLSLRVQHDYHDQLRFELAWARLLAASAGDPAAPDRIARVIALKAIAGDPVGYAWLALRDWLSLFAWPDDITASERAADARALAAMPELPILAAHWQAKDPTLRILLPPPTGLAKVAVVRIVGAVGSATALAVIALACWRTLAGGRRMAPPLVFAALAAQAMAASTALVEGGLSRYAMALWPFSAVVVLLAVAALAGTALAWRFTRPAQARA